MLVVGPTSGMLPARDALAALTTSTLLVTESKASRVVRSGVSVMRPGELPAPIPPLTSVSFVPLIITSPADAVGLDTLCEARTRVVSVFTDGPPQDTKPKQANASTAGTRADFFKRQAPNYRKTRDLSAKYGIIAEPPALHLAAAPRLSKDLTRLAPGCRNRWSSCILTKYMAADLLTPIK